MFTNFWADWFRACRGTCRLYAICLNQLRLHGDTWRHCQVQYGSALPGGRLNIAFWRSTIAFQQPALLDVVQSSRDMRLVIASSCKASCDAPPVVISQKPRSPRKLTTKEGRGVASFRQYHIPARRCDGEAIPKEQPDATIAPRLFKSNLVTAVMSAAVLVPPKSASLPVM